MPATALPSAPRTLVVADLRERLLVSAAMTRILRELANRCQDVLEEHGFKAVSAKGHPLSREGAASGGWHTNSRYHLVRDPFAGHLLSVEASHAVGGDASASAETLNQRLVLRAMRGQGNTPSEVLAELECFVVKALPRRWEDIVVPSNLIASTRPMLTSLGYEPFLADTNWRAAQSGRFVAHVLASLAP